MEDINDITTENAGEPLPSDHEAWLIRSAIAHSKVPQPDIDKAWTDFQAVGVGRRRAVLRRLAYGAVAVAAACAALFIVQTRRSAAPQPLETTQKITILSQTADTSEVTMTVRPPAARDLPSAGCTSKADATSAADDLSSSVLSSVILMNTPRGKDCNITLSDGTRVWMNADSRLEYPERFTGTRRTVRLSGEAYFEVAKDARRPFIVESSYLTTTVLGTTFNMRAYSASDASVALVEGRLSVAPAMGGQPVTVSPGQQVTLSMSRSKPTLSTTAVNTYGFTQRKDGYFYFHDATLRQIMTELGRWYNKTVVFEDPAQLDLRLHFVAERSQTLPQIINSLCEMDGVDIELGANDITVK